ncbi:AraC family transcriptional regulator [Cohnella sp. REN36]|uniref:AraC family transcriptional regulator n=1 Tax=Cohnella sp. REN36 TaxID=2887347 RepID=UPI001D143490|nr:AraC family transcriptional regulator [Cohnella sp. REN36]MCC3376033.1 AraC family transcriptional regulator [Cohnella sp. REN36]
MTAANLPDIGTRPAFEAPPYFEAHKNREGGFEFPFYAAAVDAGTEGYAVPPHWHYHMELLIFDAGEADVLLGSRTIRASAGDLLLIPPCSVHAVTADPGTASKHYVVGFDPELLAPMPALLLQVKYMLPNRPDAHLHLRAGTLAERGAAGIGAEAEALLREYSRRDPAFELAVTSGIFRLMGGLIRALPELGLDGRASGTERDRYRLRDTLAYIDAHSHEPLTASDMARISMMSYSHFAACFKRTMRTPFSAYLHFVRVRKAERLLLDPSRSITQIALETGFNDTSYFIKHFRRLRGLTPLQYRKAVLHSE